MLCTTTLIGFLACFAFLRNNFFRITKCVIVILFLLECEEHNITVIYAIFRTTVCAYNFAHTISFYIHIFLSVTHVLSS